MNAPDLLSCANVCKFWKQLSDKDDFWKLLFQQYSCNRYNIQNTTLKQKISTLSVKTIKEKLRSVHIPHRHCVEKSELVALLWQTSLLSDSDFTGIRRCWRSQTPDWLQSLSEWKATFFFEKKDAKRKRIFLEEISNQEWKLTPLWHPGLEVEFKSTFCNDFTYIDTMFHPEPIPWTFEDNNQTVIVGDYPDLSIERLCNGTWKMSNQNVIFHQMISNDEENHQNVKT
mmetsp:Transcript_33119/g.43610  ORF Transcript_33119/g.43610 Transcript_33119/m.43610 type:complete len:228 (-) Transcript_33119:194-877(-)